MNSLFMEAVKGHYPLADGPSTAKFWAPTQANIKVKDATTGGIIDQPVVGQYVPRPDRTWRSLCLWSILGVLGADHFYLRSTGTGLLKLLTLGGFGLWMIWDWLQLATEKDRILKYGMTLPFDFKTGIGQGMIAEETTYKQETDWSLWMLTLLFGCVGANQFLLKQAWAGIRVFLIFLILMIPYFVIIGAAKSEGYAQAFKNHWGGILATAFWLIVFVFGVLGTSLGYIKQVLFDPKEIMANGLWIPDFSEKAFGWWHRLFKDSGGNIAPEDESNFNTAHRWDPMALTGEQVRTKFWIKKTEAIVDETANNDSFPPFSMAAQAWKNMTNGIFSLFGKNSPIPSVAAASSVLAAVAPAPDLSALRAAALARGSTVHVGGARNSEPALSTEAKIIGAVLVALLGGAAVKTAVNTLIPE